MLILASKILKHANVIVIHASNILNLSINLFYYLNLNFKLLQTFKLQAFETFSNFLVRISQANIKVWFDNFF